MKAIIATKNEGKIEGAKRALEKYFQDVEVIGIPADSEVGDEPVNLDIYKGAKNRVKNLKAYCKENGIKADLFLASESGIFDCLGRWLINNIAVIEDDADFESYGTSASFPIPEKYVQEVIDTDLSKLMNRLFSEDDERHNHGGGIQLLTHSVISRLDLTEQAFVMALTKYINKDVWN